MVAITDQTAFAFAVVAVQNRAFDDSFFQIAGDLVRRAPSAPSSRGRSGGRSAALSRGFSRSLRQLQVLGQRMVDVWHAMMLSGCMPRCLKSLRPSALPVTVASPCGSKRVTRSRLAPKRGERPPRMRQRNPIVSRSVGGRRWRPDAGAKTRGRGRHALISKISLISVASKLSWRAGEFVY